MKVAATVREERKCLYVAPVQVQFRSLRGTGFGRPIWVSSLGGADKPGSPARPLLAPSGWALTSLPIRQFFFFVRLSAASVTGHPKGWGSAVLYFYVASPPESSLISSETKRNREAVFTSAHVYLMSKTAQKEG